MSKDKKRSTSVMTRESQEKIIGEIVSVEKYFYELLDPIENEASYWKSITANLSRMVELQVKSDQIRNKINSLENVKKEIESLTMFP